MASKEPIRATYTCKLHNHLFSSHPSHLHSVTFLVTLFLLLFISAAIVLRSYLLRRRFQRQIDEALASGLLITPGSRRRRLGPKPKIHNTWVTQGGHNWCEMMVSKSIISSYLVLFIQSVSSAHISTACPSQTSRSTYTLEKFSTAGGCSIITASISTCTGTSQTSS
jgi:hypothetical protein